MTPVSRLRAADLLPVGTLGLRTRRMRAALSMLGVAIGIAAVVAVLGITRHNLLRQSLCGPLVVAKLSLLLHFSRDLVVARYLLPCSCFDLSASLCLRGRVRVCDVSSGSNTSQES